MVTAIEKEACQRHVGAGFHDARHANSTLRLPFVSTTLRKEESAIIFSIISCRVGCLFFPDTFNFGRWLSTSRVILGLVAVPHLRIIFGRVLRAQNPITAPIFRKATPTRGIPCGRRDGLVQMQRCEFRRSRYRLSGRSVARFPRDSSEAT